MTIHDLNLPFGRELQEQHEALRASMQRIQSELGSGPSHERGGRGDLHECLPVFREQLIQHFRFEERNGFDGGFGLDDPEVERRMHELVLQHHEFEKRLGVFLQHLETAGAGARIPEALLADLGAFFGDLRRHDAEESALFLRIACGPKDFTRGFEGP